MQLSDLITENGILVPLKSAHREDAFIEMVDFMASKALIPRDLRDEVLKALEVREATMTTAVGDALALPHASVNGLQDVVCMFAKVGPDSAGIDCQAPDGTPVKAFLTILVPNDEYSTHLRTLATVSANLRRPGVKAKLADAASAAEVGSLLKED